MMKNSKLKFSEYMQNISRPKSFGRFVLVVLRTQSYIKYLESKLYVDQCVCLNIQTSLIRRENEEKSYHGSIDRPFMDSHFSKGASIAF